MSYDHWKTTNPDDERLGGLELSEMSYSEAVDKMIEYYLGRLKEKDNLIAELATALKNRMPVLDDEYTLKDLSLLQRVDEVK